MPFTKLLHVKRMHYRSEDITNRNKKTKRANALNLREKTQIKTNVFDQREFNDLNSKPNVDIWAATVPTPFTNEGKICYVRVDRPNSLRLRAKFRLDWFILSHSGGRKPQILPFLVFSSLCCRQLAAYEVR